ncbi:hypothetical protein RIF29_19019 [Crotalaria pallida]|uniref:Uncharacterized protein n=1 Tax=Crotalaria pallida TaxID=3830 RepID=A0AAN9F108_CROPI
MSFGPDGELGRQVLLPRRELVSNSQFLCPGSPDRRLRKNQEHAWPLLLMPCEFLRLCARYRFFKRSVVFGGSVEAALICCIRTEIVMAIN